MDTVGKTVLDWGISSGGSVLFAQRLLLALDVPVPSAAEVVEELLDAGERLGVGEMLSLKLVVLVNVLFMRNGKVGPVREELGGGRSGTALKLGLDAPWQ